MPRITIVTLYKTSRGIFRNKYEAEKKKNREEINDRGHVIGLEEVEEIQALSYENVDPTSYPYDCKSYFPAMYFKLNPLKVE